MWFLYFFEKKCAAFLDFDLWHYIEDGAANATKKAGPTVVTTLNLGSITAEPSQAAIKKSMADAMGAGVEVGAGAGRELA